MKCIDDELIQKFIDGETNPQETNLIKKHLEECAQCARKVEEHRAFAEAIKRGIYTMGKQTVVIPEFIAPTIPKRRFKVKTKHYIYATTAAAACVAFVMLFLPQRENEVNEYQMIYCFDGNFDSNRTYSQHEMTIKIFDSNGKMIEFN